jgi:NADPH-dependent 2,4-dienoyl-CoA reductase/sulfur reductase-like enzyme
VPGLAGPGVFVLRSFDDAVRLRGAVTAAHVRATDAAPPRALVLGASFAGVEIASVLLRAGLDVSIVERETRVLPRVAHPACADLVERHLRARGHDIRLGVSVTSTAAAPHPACSPPATSRARSIR